MGKRPVVALICLSHDPQDSFADYLERRGYEVRETDEDWMAESLLAGSDVDVAVIGDRYSPGAALDLLRGHAGEEGPGIVIVSSHPDLIEKVLALELGAADIVPSRWSGANWRLESAASPAAAARRNANWSSWRTRPSTCGRHW